MGSGMLGLEMSLHHHIPQQNTQNPHQQQQLHPQQPMSVYGHHEVDQQHPQTQLSVKQGYPYSTKSKNQTLTLSDDDEQGLTAENSADDGKRKISPWQRMKWTDNMVRLLIMVVYYIGDEAGFEVNNEPAAAKKKGAGVLQKKGKWKSVSRAMMEKGFYVSPQQCEDKFNDLNKRYKRVNDILGKGTACKVVENQNMLDTMDHLSQKMKEEVKKLLNSKHLFFREMCAYHNSCGHAGASSSAAGGTRQSPEIATEPSNSQQPRCLHSTENSTIAANLVRGEVEGSKLAKNSRDEEEDDDDEDEDEDDDEDDDDEVVEGGARGHHEQGHDEDEDIDERSSRKRHREGAFLSPVIQQLSSEVTSVFQDETKSAFEKRQWMKTRLMQLKEQHVGYQCQAFELEKQRLKWMKYSSKKEREMEKDKLTNDRMKLENERMVLLIRQKEIELLDLHQQQQRQQQQQQSSRKSDPSSITG